MRGKKECQSCHQIIGAPTKVCPHCKHIQSKPVQQSQEISSQSAEPASPVATPASKPKAKRWSGQKLSDGNIIHQSTTLSTPAGKPPVIPPGYPYEGRVATEEEVEVWIEETLAAGMEKQITYTREAIRYFAQRFWPVNDSSGEYERVKEIIWNKMGDPIDEDFDLSEDEEALLAGEQK